VIVIILFEYQRTIIFFSFFYVSACVFRVKIVVFLGTILFFYLFFIFILFLIS